MLPTVSLKAAQSTASQKPFVADFNVPIADIDSASLIPPNLPFNNSMDPLQFKVNRGSFQVLLR